MKRFYSTIIALVATVSMMAQGWPSNYGGVMLQGFSWDSYVDTQWSNLESQADELSQYFNLIWVPQSGNCNTSHNVMGYTPVYYFNQNSSFGTEAQLRSMIKAFKNKGTGIVADVVVNHRNNLGVGGSWVDYPAETYNGVTYQMHSTDIVANDDGGQTQTWATANGYSLSSNNDEGQGWSGCRDLDHKSENVQKVIKAYVKYLVDDLGYTGFRYDMVKGFNGSHVADYNDAAGVAYSVGECWDSNSTIKNWINATGKKSAAFDFQFRYNVRDAINANDWSKLNSTNNLVHDAGYRQWAVTFVENHDTQYRSASEQLDPIRKDTLAANAYLLAMPGTPCVFLPHWKAYKSEIKSMIDVRHAAGITNTSTYTNISPGPTLYRNTVTGTKGKLLVCLGNRAGASSALGGYTNVLSGYHYAYLLDNSLETAFADNSREALGRFGHERRKARLHHQRQHAHGKQPLGGIGPDGQYHFFLHTDSGLVEERQRVGHRHPGIHHQAFRGPHGHGLFQRPGLVGCIFLRLGQQGHSQRLMAGQDRDRHKDDQRRKVVLPDLRHQCLQLHVQHHLRPRQRQEADCRHRSHQRRPLL